MRSESQVRTWRCDTLSLREERPALRALEVAALLATLSAVAFFVAQRAAVGSDDSRDVVIKRLDEMSAAEKRELQRKQERFYKLPVEEQDRLTRLHRDISNDPRAVHLHGVMERYASWLKTLPSGQRADLLGLPRKERIEMIKRLMQKQHTSRFRGIVTHELAEKDSVAIVKWMDDFVKRHEKEILARMPMLKERMAQVDDPKRRQMLIHVALRFAGRKDVLRPNQQDIERLKSQLSPEARQELDKAQQDGHLAELAQRWMRAAMFSKITSAPVDRNELRRFYNDVASKDPKTREYLDNMRPEDMLAELTCMYNRHRFEQFFGGEKPPFGRPGSGWRGRGYPGRSGERKPPFGGLPRTPQDNRQVPDSRKAPR